MSDLALDGLKVLELGDFISAPYATKLMADLGADVVKVEPPGSGDNSRSHGPYVDDEPHPERSGLYLFLNANKRSVTLDLSSKEGASLFSDLVGWADVLIHNVPPQDLEDWGLNYERLVVDHPDLIMVAITVFGYDTPYRDWKGYALTATAASGISSRIGDPGQTPLWVPYSAADFQGGVHGAITAMLAHRTRRDTGEGQHAWVSIVEVMGTFMGGAAIPPFLYGGVAMRGRSGTHMNAFYPWQVVPVADGYFQAITMVDTQWQRFIELMDNPPWAEDERLENRWLSMQWADELDANWYPWMKERTKAELAQLFAENKISFQPINTVEEVMNSEHLALRDFWEDVEHAEAGTYRMPGAPYRLSGTPWSIRRPPPLLGQHNHELYVETLGRDDDEINRLSESGVI